MLFINRHFNGFDASPTLHKLISVTTLLSLCLCLISCINQTRADAAFDDSVSVFEAESEPTFDTNEFDLPVITDTTIWPRIRSGFQLGQHLEHQTLQVELRWYKKNTAYLNRVMQRAAPFLHYILEEAEKRGLPTELVLLPIVESAFQPFAYSHGRAAGLWQFIPSTGKLYGLKQDWWYDGRRDIHSSTQAALNYLDNLNKMFDGDWLHALAAYNSGPGTVNKAIRKNKRLHRSTDFWHLNLPKETRAYVPKLLALKELITNPHQHEITLRCIQDIPGFIAVDTGSQLDLALAAKLGDIDLNTLYRYNPAFNRWATSPNGPHQLLLPPESADTFTENLALLGHDKKIKWKRHRIKEGETLSHIAVKYNTTVKHLKSANNLRDKPIRTGKYLLIPLASQNQSHYALSASQRKQRIQNNKQGSHKLTHTVREGESFWLIARRHGVSMHKLSKWNAMAIKDKLKPGQKLVIWQDKGSDSQNTLGINGKPANTIRAISYTVRNGDSLSRIATRYRVSINDLHKWNTIKGKYLQPGQRLKLYVDITNQAGDSS